MIPAEMIIRQPPKQMLGEFGSKLYSSPGATGKLGDRLSYGQIGALDEGSITAAAQPGSLEAGGRFRW